MYCLGIVICIMDMTYGIVQIFFGDYGNVIVLEFAYRRRTLYAAYAHLGKIFAHKDTVVGGGVA